MPALNFINENYNRKEFTEFLKTCFNNADKFLSPIKIEAEENTLWHLGNLSTADEKTLAIDKKTLGIYEVEISEKTNLTRNRVGLRNMVAKEIKKTSLDGAIAIYYTPNNPQWRLSFFSIEYEIDENNQPTKKQTATKRYTYLLGKNAQTRTAKQQLSKLNKQSTLKDIEEAFSVEPLNKEFYEAIFKWYKKAQDQVIFPNDDNSTDHTKLSLIRLLTRLLFIWFIKEKDLVKKELFNKDDLQEIIKWDKDSSYYKAILQNLFFATLNREIPNRSLSTSNSHFVTNVYRYHSKSATKLFEIADDAIIDLFAKTPFLNGGLFECLDREIDQEDYNKYPKRIQKSGLRIDGFSNNADNPLKVPNDLFFNSDKTGLIDILEQYQFTVEESTPSDIAVALDPELLGKIFENLLASYNPETGEQARKATGSFYTPRAIVEYMVDQSLQQYLQTTTSLKKDDITDLLNEETKSDLNGTAKSKVIKAIDKIKIVDPAVGSGAFAIGILQKLVQILFKCDPENTLYKQRQLDSTDKIEDSVSREESIRAIEKAFSEANQYNAYGKKLTLIENCIHGVDIQPIAITIAKLRFFISLTIEQTTNENRDDNYGLLPLPNLDFKLITANSLISLQDSQQNNQLMLINFAIEPIWKELEETRQRYFTAKTLKTKRKYRQRDKELRKELQTKFSNHLNGEDANKLAHWDPFSQNSADWFDSKWMFGVTDGFNVVIGNPPYIQLQKDSGKLGTKYQYQGYQSFDKTGDIYMLFYERGHQLLSDNGNLCFITSNKWMRAGYGKKLRAYFVQNTQPKKLVDLGSNVFDNATVDTNILLLGKQPQQPTMEAIKLDNAQHKNLKRLPYLELPIPAEGDSWIIANPEQQTIIQKIERIGTPLKEWDININRGILTGYNEAFIIDGAKRQQLIAEDPKSTEIIKPILRGKDIKKYEVNFEELWLLFIPWHFPLHNDPTISGNSTKAEKEFKKQYPAVYNHLLKYKKQLSQRNKSETGVRYEWYALQRCAASYYPEFAKEKIVYPDIAKKPTFHFLKSETFTNNTVYIITGSHILYIISILNSCLVRFYFPMISSDLGSGSRYFKPFVESIPIPKISETKQKPFVDKVEQILKAKAENPQADTSKIEEQIDQMVYNLYNLTPDEIKIVETN